MKYGDLIKGRVIDIDDKGRGICQVDATSQNIVVPFTAPGDIITSSFVKRDKGTKVGRLVSVDTPSKDRIQAPCPHAGVCGGCLWQHLTYEAQLKLKLNMINRAFESAGHVERVSTITPCPAADHDFRAFFRNRMDYVIGWKGELGLKEYGSWNHYLDLKTCFLLDEQTPAILEIIRELMRELKLKPWDSKTYEGDLRYAIIRLGKNTNERMLTLLVKDLSRFSEADKKTIVTRLAPLCTTLYLAENPDITDVSYGKTFVLLHGHEFLTEEVNGLRYTIHPNSFFQTNTHMAAKLQEAVIHMIFPERSGVTAVATAVTESKGMRILDLYCGLGFFGIACAQAGATVYGHELDANAIVLAERNAKTNNVNERCRWGAGSVEDLDWAKENPDLVIIDPPRAGLHPRALKTLIENRPPKIVYVSCNYRRLTEELKLLKEHYVIESLQALDLFPHTPHVEVVVSLKTITPSVPGSTSSPKFFY